MNLNALGCTGIYFVCVKQRFRWYLLFPQRRWISYFLQFLRSKAQSPREYLQIVFCNHFYPDLLVLGSLRKGREQPRKRKLWKEACINIFKHKVVHCCLRLRCQWLPWSHSLGALNSANDPQHLKEELLKEFVTCVRWGMGKDACLPTAHPETYWQREWLQSWLLECSKVNL